MPDTQAARPGEYKVPASAPLCRCSSCHAPIIWTTTAAKRKIPLSVTTIRTDEQGKRWALNHFADCPNASQHRRPAGPNKSGTVDLRDLPDYMKRNGLVVVGSTVTDDGKGRLLIELKTRKA